MLGQVCIAVRGDAVRPQSNDFAQGHIETAHRLQRQTIDQINTDRLEPRLARRRDQCVDLLLALPTIDRRLYLRVKVLHTEAQAIEAQAT
ncbi:hypothetical protein D3C72_1360590 [compost metagenome]